MDFDTSKATAPTEINDIAFERSFVKNQGIKKVDHNLEDLFWQIFANKSSNLLKRINASGSVTKAELAKAISSGTLQGIDAQIGAALYRRFTSITVAAGKHTDAKINSADLALFSKRSAEAEKLFHKADDLAYWSDDQGNLKKISGSKGFLSLEDLKNAEQMEKSSAENRAMITVLKESFGGISKSGKLTVRDIDTYYKICKTNPDFAAAQSIVVDMRRVELAQQNKQAHKLFSNENEPLKSISPIAVLQGYTGDCAFKAALAGLANTRPQEIHEMIKTHGSDFQINMPGAKVKQQILSKPSDEELGLYGDYHGTGGFWPTLLSKAYGELVFKQANPIDKLRMKSQTSNEWAGEFGNEFHVIQTLTGHKAVGYFLADHNDSKLTEALKTGQKERSIMVASTKKGKGSTPDGFRKDHGYTLMKVSNFPDGSLKLTVRDPGGLHKNTRADGTRDISLSVLRKNFSAIYIESNQKP